MIAEDVRFVLGKEDVVLGECCWIKAMGSRKTLLRAMKLCVSPTEEHESASKAGNGTIGEIDCGAESPKCEGHPNRSQLGEEIGNPEDAKVANLKMHMAVEQVMRKSNCTRDLAQVSQS